uniref:Uncharacterized protein n=1 Tax=Strigamia maritima TaxID=126957 RepID=T1IUL0_STRMM
MTNKSNLIKIMNNFAFFYFIYFFFLNFSALHLQRTALSNAQLHGQQPIPQQQLAATTSPEAPTTNQMNPQQRARIQCLQMEGERLKLRQQEIMRQLKPQQNINNVGIPSYNDMLIRQTISEGIASSPMPDLPPVSTGVDPFLGAREIHSRQESSDSGIGLEGNYNLAQTSDDFLNRMDENMDTVSENCISSSEQQQISNDFCNLDIQSQDMTALAGGNMDTDELEPSLQEELASDLLNDVEALLNTNRMDTMLTWL